MVTRKGRREGCREGCCEGWSVIAFPDGDKLTVGLGLFDP